MLLSSCSTQPYWTLQNAPVPVLHTVHVDYPCNDRYARGCWNLIGQTVELKKGLNECDNWCANRHETKGHADGWVHPLNMAFVLDCGPTDAQIEAARKK